MPRGNAELRVILHRCTARISESVNPAGCFVCSLFWSDGNKEWRARSAPSLPQRIGGMLGQSASWGAIVVRGFVWASPDIARPQSTSGAGDELSLLYGTSQICVGLFCTLRNVSAKKATFMDFVIWLQKVLASLCAQVRSPRADCQRFHVLTLRLNISQHAHAPAQPGLAHVLMTSWALDFESRDHRFLAHKSGILPTLQAMVTLTNTARMAGSLSARLDPAISCPEGNSETEKAAAWWQHWTPWSLDSIREGFVQVSSQSLCAVSCVEESI